MIEKIDHYSMHPHPSIYDEDAMTALELAARTAGKVNEVIDAENDFEKLMTERQTEHERVVKTDLDRIPTLIDDTVQDHIDNGEFARDIQESIGNLEQRVDNLVSSVPEGGTTMDAEVIDGRVDNIGTTRANLGASIRAQIFDAYAYANARAVIGSTDKMTVTYDAGAALIKMTRAAFDLRKPNETNVMITIDLTDENRVSNDTKNALTDNGDGTYTFKLAVHQILVYNLKDDKCYTRGQNRAVYGDIVLLYNAWGRLCGGVLWNEHVAKQLENLQAEQQYAVDLFKAEKSYFYIGADGRSLIKTETDVVYGHTIVQLPIMIYLNSTDGNTGIRFEQGTLLEWTWNNCIEEITDTYVRIKMPANTVLIYDASQQRFGVIETRSLTRKHTVLLVNNWALLSEGMLLPFLHDQAIKALQADETTATADAGRTANVAALLNTDRRTDAFIFATDFHPVHKSNDWRPLVEQYVDRLKMYDAQLPLDFVASGGDWMNDTTTQAEACHALGVIYGKMFAAFGDRAHLILGNHDTNYQGKLTEDAATWTGKLSQTVINKLWYKNHGGKSFYSFNTANATYHVFDSGIDSDYNSISTYQVEQLTAFAEKLISGQKTDHVILVHMIKVSDTIGVCAFMQKVAEIAKACNDRVSAYTYGDKTFDFSTATAKVRLMIGGHTHADENGTLSGIPYVLTKNYYDAQSFDYVVADYDAGTVRFIREGTGSDRTFTI